MGKLGNRILVAVGVLVLVVSGYLAMGTLTVIRRMGSAPARTTVAAAKDGAWVALEDATLRCDTRVVQHGATFFVGSDRAGQVPFLAQLAGDRGCDAAALDGVFLAGRFTRAFLRERLKISLGDGEDLRVFTQSLAPPNQRALLYRTLPWMIVGVALVVIAIRRLRRARAAPRG